MLNPNLSIAIAEGHRRELLEQARRERALHASPRRRVNSSRSEGLRRRTRVVRPLKAAVQRSHAR
jgi:hypothetical protein